MRETTPSLMALTVAQAGSPDSPGLPWPWRALPGLETLSRARVCFGGQTVTSAPATEQGD